ncbi:zinc finger protein 862-like [Branchiostoma floridae x Branchiostoma japonicum]
MPKRKKDPPDPPPGQQSMLLFTSKSKPSSSPPSKRPDVVRGESGDSDDSDKSAETTAATAASQDHPGKEAEASVSTASQPPGMEADDKSEDPVTAAAAASQDPPGKKADDKSTTKEDANKTVSKKFVKKWLQTFKWLVYDPRLNLMYCKMCRGANKKNAFARGTQDFRIGRLELHVEKGDHPALVEAENLRPNNVAAVVNRMLGARELAVIAALRNVYYLAKENIPSVKYQSLNELCEMQGCGALAALRVSANASYTHWDTVTDMQEAISNVLRDDLLAKIATSHYIGTMTDKSTDISVEKLLLTYINVLSPEGHLETHYLCNTQVTTCDAVSIATTLKQQLARHNIDLNSVTGVCTDGAAVMVGRTNGVVAKLKAENPIIVGTHCAPHKLNLAAQQASKNFPSLQRYQRLVGSIYGYFSNSASRQARLKEMTDILETDHVKLKSIHAVRWLSYNEANLALNRTLPAVKETLKEDGENLHDATAEGLAKSIMCYDFLAYNHLMCDILGAIALLSKTLQQDGLSFASIKVCCTTCIELPFKHGFQNIWLNPNPEVDTAINTLRTMQLGNGDVKFAEFLADITVHDDSSDTFFKGEKIQATPQMRQAVERARNEYINELIDNIESRFPETGILSACKIFEPRHLPEDNVERAAYGREELTTILDHFCPAGREPLVNRDACRREWTPFKELVRANYANVSFKSLVKQIKFNHAAFLPEIAKLLQAVAVVPVTTVPCERGFSVQNRIKTKARARIKATTLDTLMRINIEGPPISEFAFDRALDKWRTAKPRRIFQGP